MPLASEPAEEAATPISSSAPDAETGELADKEAGTVEEEAALAESSSGVRYGINDVPPWWLCILLGFQTFLTMLGSSVLIPSLLVPAMGGDSSDLAEVICTCFFAAGINTLLQTILGARLPIVQGGSFAYISVVFAVTAQIQGSMMFDTEHDRFIYTMRALQGGIIGSALIALGLALLGLFYLLLQHLSALTIGANIAILGLSLYSAGWPAMGACIQLGLPAMCLTIIFAFYMNRLRVFGFAWFGLFPVVLALGCAWLYAYVFTVAGVYDNSSAATQQACTTDQSNFGNILSTAPWFRVPYPGQWGAPLFTGSSVLTFLAAVIPAALESIGDYFAAARLANAPPPPPDVVSRALAVESVCCVVSGLFGTTSGSTAYAENVGAIAITGVASRRVVQLGAGMMICIACLGKFGALFASIPQALVAGLLVVLFSLIAGVGFANLDGVSLRSTRNVFILGFGLYCGLSVPAYFESYTAANGHGPVDTGSDTFNSIANSLFATPAAVCLLCTLLLDVTVPAAPGERPWEAWQRSYSSVTGNRGQKWYEDGEMDKLYGWPFGLTPRWRRRVDPLKQALWDALARGAAALDCRRCCAGRQRRQSTRGVESRPSPAAAPAELPLALIPPSVGSQEPAGEQAV